MLLQAPCETQVRGLEPIRTTRPQASIARGGRLAREGSRIPRFASAPARVVQSLVAIFGEFCY